MNGSNDLEEEKIALKYVCVYIYTFLWKLYYVEIDTFYRKCLTFLASPCAGETVNILFCVKFNFCILWK